MRPEGKLVELVKEVITSRNLFGFNPD